MFNDSEPRDLLNSPRIVILSCYPTFLAIFPCFFQRFLPSHRVSREFTTRRVRLGTYYHLFTWKFLPTIPIETSKRSLRASILFQTLRKSVSFSYLWIFEKDNASEIRPMFINIRTRMKTYVNLKIILRDYQIL